MHVLKIASFIEASDCKLRQGRRREEKVSKVYFKRQGQSKTYFLQFGFKMAGIELLLSDESFREAVV